MAEKFLKTRILQKVDTAANWKAHNSVLEKGELGYASDTHELKLGDGSTKWENLPNIAAGTLNEPSHAWKANFGPSNVTNPEWLVGWNSSQNTLDAVKRSSLKVDYAASAGNVAWANTNHPSTFTPSAHTHNFTGSTTTVNGTCTPLGSVSTPTISITPSTTTITEVAGTGSLPAMSCTYTANTKNLKFTFSAGTKVTTTNTTVLTKVTASSNALTFTGQETKVSGSCTPQGTVGAIK